MHSHVLKRLEVHKAGSMLTAFDQAKTGFYIAAKLIEERVVIGLIKNEGM
jgi:hypothetical protein